MYMAPTITAVNREIKAPMYIDLQIVRVKDGLSRFQAILLSLSCSSSSMSSLFSVEQASVTLTLTLLDAR